MISGTLDRKLRSVRFGPRASFGPELLGPAPARRPARSGAAVGAPPAPRPPRRSPCLRPAARWRSPTSDLSRHTDAVTVDRCCYDLDGGGDAGRRGADPGRARRPGAPASGIRGSGRIAKLHARPTWCGSIAAAAPAVHGLAGEGIVTIEQCCLDFDGGGPDDDGLLVIGVPPDRVLMAAIYETGAVSRVTEAPARPAGRCADSTPEETPRCRHPVWVPPLPPAVMLTAPLAAQQVDTLRRDTTKVTTLETIEVTGSIAPTAGPVIGSGIPARISTVTGRGDRRLGAAAAGRRARDPARHLDLRRPRALLSS